MQEWLLRGHVWEKWAGNAQWPGERRHLRPHHRHDLISTRPDQLHRIGVCRRGLLLLWPLSPHRSIYLPPPADSYEVSLLWPLNLLYTPPHRTPIHWPNLFTYKLHASEHQAWHPSRVHSSEKIHELSRVIMGLPLRCVSPSAHTCWLWKRFTLNEQQRTLHRNGLNHRHWMF